MTPLSDLQFKSHYWQDPVLKRVFKRFILDIHKLDFRVWDNAGFWDDAYMPFSFFSGNTMVANVCIYQLETLIQGRRSRLLQISGVGTLPEWRRQGLSRELTRRGLGWAGERHAGVFLFADEEAIPYYRQTGFQEVDEFVEWIPVVPPRPIPGVRQLNLTRKTELARIYELACRQEPISNILSIVSPKLLMFHALYTLRECCFEIPELGCIVFFRRQADTLVIYDILAEKLPRFEEIYPYLARASDRQVEFRFFTDRLGLSDVQKRRLNGNHPFVLENFPLNQMVFPFTSHA